MDSDNQEIPNSWAPSEYQDLLEYIQPTHFIVESTEYDDKYDIPVLTAGKSFIKGYTNEKHGIYGNLPAIIFDDFTTASRYVNFPFKVKSSAMKILVPSCDLVNLKFIYYCMQVNTIRTDTHKRYWISVYAKKQLFIPPLNEQHRIVAKIEELFSELDKGIENLKTAQAQLKVYRQALLKHAFEGKLTSVSSDAVGVQKTLGNLLDFLTSGSRGWKQYYAAAGDLFIRAQNIKHDVLELDDIAFVSLPEKAEGLRAQVKKGDLLITITGANVTKSALVERDVGTAYVSQHVALCRPTAEVFPRFLYWFIVAEAAGRKQLSDMSYGAGKPVFNLENIRSVRVPLPGLPEQQIIVELIEGKLSEADQLDITITTSLQQAEALRQSILKRAFSGQLVAQDASDEPALALLARIRAENMQHTERSKKSLSRSKRNE